MRPDHALQNETRLRFLTPHAEPPEGLSMVAVDLTAFFAIVERIGRDEALLLLVVRALRQRTGLLALKVHDLAWMLRVSNRRVILWLDRLTRERLVVYHVEDFWGVDTVIVEIAEQREDAHSFAPRVRVDLPSHWFVQVLPLIGRTTFTVYLFFHLSEHGNAEIALDHLVAMVRLRGRWHARLHVARLRRAALLKRDPRDRLTLVLSDPSPPTRLARIRLRFRAVPLLRWWFGQIGVLLLALVFVVLALVLTLRFLPSRP
jgi:hypothetical protein